MSQYPGPPPFRGGPPPSYPQYPPQPAYQQPPAGYQPHPLGYSTGADVGTIARFFNAVYGWMAAGLALTALVAWFVSTQPDLMRMVYNLPVLIVLFIAQLALVWTVSAAVNRINASTATALFILYSALNGLTLAGIFVIYTHASLVSAFVVAAGMFGAMSVYGMVTKRDLTGLGSLLFMGLIGFVIASIVSVFWYNSVFVTILNYVGVAIFIGLTAYDTQRLKAIAMQTAGMPGMAARMAISGALALYLDFINLFLLLLRIMGDRR